MADPQYYHQMHQPVPQFAPQAPQAHQLAPQAPPQPAGPYGGHQPYHQHQTLHQFASEAPAPQAGQHGGQQSTFEVVRDKFLQVNLGVPGSTGGVLTQVLIKAGSMVGYRGDIGFERQSLREEGLGTVLKRTLLTDEGVTFAKATAKSGFAQLFLADSSKHVTVLRLQGDSIVVNGNDVLAIEPCVTHKIQKTKTVAGMVSGGFFSVRLSGTGLIAFLTHGKPLTLVVAPGYPPVYTDPQATVAWSGDLAPDYHTDFHFKQLFGRSSKDSFQMQFSKGNGIVVIQPLEEQISS